MKFALDYENAIANRGNLFQLKRVMERAMAGGTVTLGFLGGSITQGSLATKPENCYAYRVYEWWSRQFPDAKTMYVNAGIGATTSEYGVARVEADLLKHQPDVVFVEFSVNDEPTEHFKETYEGLVRKILREETAPALLLVHNVYYHNGANAQVMHAQIGRYYDLPEISMQSCIYPEVVKGHITNREITPDDLHPNDLGHEMVASVITYFLAQVREELTQKEEAPEKKMPEPLTENAFENSYRLQNDNCRPEMSGFVADETVQNGVADCFKHGWTAEKAGDAISFPIKGSCITACYRRSVKHPAPVAEAVVDGDKEHAVRLDANFDETWGDKLELTPLLLHGENKEHTVEIRLLDGTEDCVVPFYLVAVLGS